MKIRIKKISPRQAGNMLGAIYALFGIVIIPIILLIAIFGPTGTGRVPIEMAIVMPLLYIAGGFIGGIIGALVYNLAAGWVGGMEVEFEEEKAS